MKFHSKRMLSVLLVFVLVLGLGATVFAENAGESEQEVDQKMAQVLVQYLSDLTDDVVLNYKNGVTKEELLLNACKALMGDDIEKLKVAIGGALNNLDAYSHFYTGSEYEAMKQHITGNKGILGVQMKIENGQNLITGFIEGLPAATSGLQVGDILIEVDGQSVEGLSSAEITQMISGEPGTSVTLVVRREGVDEPLSFDIVRGVELVNPVSYETLENKIQYIKIDSINAYAGQFFQQAMDDADAKNIHQIILDLRNNGGGTLDSAISILSRFIPKGETIVSLHFKDETNNMTFTSQGFSDKKYRVVLLVNEYSASASEVIAGALKDYGLAYLVGTTTYGKGAVQQFSDLNGLNSAMSLTIAHYLTPNGTDVQNTGITPDLQVANEIKYYSNADFLPLEYSEKPRRSDKTEQVRAVKQRLIALGYALKDDDLFDAATEEAVKQFQAQEGLYPYGVADITTQIRLNNRAITAKKVYDTQMEYAVGYMKNVKE